MDTLFMKTGCLLMTCLFLIAGCEIQAQEQLQAPGPKVIYHPASSENLPFSEAVQVGDMLYLAGQLGTIPGQGLVAGGTQAETRQTLENIKEAVERLGSSMDRVVKCTVFMADMNEWGEMNEVYKTYFPNLPARSAMGGVDLALDARLEIECIAAMK